MILKFRQPRSCWLTKSGFEFITLSKIWKWTICNHLICRYFTFLRWWLSSQQSVKPWDPSSESRWFVWIPIEWDDNKTCDVHETWPGRSLMFLADFPSNQPIVKTPYGFVWPIPMLGLCGQCLRSGHYTVLGRASLSAARGLLHFITS